MAQAASKRNDALFRVGAECEEDRRFFSSIKNLHEVYGPVSMGGSPGR